MADVRKALKLVNELGSEVQRCRLAYMLGESTDRSPVERHLEQLQLPSGGFPYQDHPGNPYCLSSTGRALKIMVEMGLADTPLCQRTADFVESLQHPDGHWEENPQLVQLKPPFWDRPGDKNTNLWLTGNLADQLTRLGRGDTLTVDSAASFLLRHRRPDGSFQGFRHTTWLAIAVLAPRLGLKDPVVTSALGALGSFRDWDAPSLTWALECLHWAGVPHSHSVSTSLLRQLEELQRPDGYWKSPDNPQDKVTSTLEALIVLKYYGRL